MYPSGMAAIASLLRYLNPARIYLPADVYHGTRSYVTAAPRAWQAVEAFDELAPGDVAWLETPSNPKCLITDIAQVVSDVGSRGVTVVVDSTFATPVLQQPLSLGADYAVHSSTKYIGGHSDAMGGVVVAADPNRAAELLTARVVDGTIPGSLDVWLTLRGVRTLPLRIARQSETAAAIADHLNRAWAAGVVSGTGRPSRPRGGGPSDVAAAGQSCPSSCRRTRKRPRQRPASRSSAGQPRSGEWSPWSSTGPASTRSHPPACSDCPSGWRPPKTSSPTSMG